VVPARRTQRAEARRTRSARTQTAAHSAARTVATLPAPAPPFADTLDAEVQRYAREVLALVQTEEFDVIHAHDWMSFPAALLVAEQRAKPLVVHFHSCERERRGEHALEEVRAIEQAAITAAVRVLAVSQRSADTLEREYALQPAKLRVLHNALSPLPQVPAVPPAERVVLYAGRLSLQKGPDVFLEAAARVHARLPDVRFVLAGEGELYPELVKLARTLGIEEVVRFTGFLDGRALAEAHAGAAAFVMPSRAEPFGLGALEALALGVPTLVSDDAGVTEVVRSVLRFEPENVDELADKLVAVLSFPSLAAELRRSGLRETRRLRWDRPARTLVALYDEVAT
jgi:glycosyltransferase involved in cell wall biosynthesis